MVRWVVKLAEFDLDIQDRKGKNSANVDGITRTPPPPSDTYGKVEVESLYDTKETQEAVVAVSTRKRAYEATSEKGKKRRETGQKRTEEEEKERAEKGEEREKEIPAEEEREERKKREIKRKSQRKGQTGA